jgi:hypothetical protein
MRFYPTHCTNNTDIASSIINRKKRILTRSLTRGNVQRGRSYASTISQQPSAAYDVFSASTTIAHP